jgi:hypothetical protein
VDPGSIASLVPGGPWIRSRIGKDWIRDKNPCRTFKSGLRIRILLGQWIRIRIRNPDPGGQKCPAKVEKI